MPKPRYDEEKDETRHAAVKNTVKTWQTLTGGR